MTLLKFGPSWIQDLVHQDHSLTLQQEQEQEPFKLSQEFMFQLYKPSPLPLDIDMTLPIISEESLLPVGMQEWNEEELKLFSAPFYNSHTRMNPTHRLYKKSSHHPSMVIGGRKEREAFDRHFKGHRDKESTHSISTSTCTKDTPIWSMIDTEPIIDIEPRIDPKSMVISRPSHATTEPPRLVTPTLTHSHTKNDSTIHSESTQWTYKDPQGNIQGPFSHQEMNRWYQANYFPSDLLVKKVLDPDFVTLAQYKQWCQGASPFDATQPDITHNTEKGQTLNPFSTPTKTSHIAHLFQTPTTLPPTLSLPDHLFLQQKDPAPAKNQTDLFNTNEKDLIKENPHEKKKKNHIFDLIKEIAPAISDDLFNHHSSNKTPSFKDPIQKKNKIDSWHVAPTEKDGIKSEYDSNPDLHTQKKHPSYDLVKDLTRDLTEVQLHDQPIKDENESSQDNIPIHHDTQKQKKKKNSTLKQTSKKEIHHKMDKKFIHSDENEIKSPSIENNINNENHTKETHENQLEQDSPQFYSTPLSSLSHLPVTNHTWQIPMTTQNKSLSKIQTEEETQKEKLKDIAAQNKSNHIENAFVGKRWADTVLSSNTKNTSTKTLKNSTPNLQSQSTPAPTKMITSPTPPSSSSKTLHTHPSINTTNDEPQLPSQDFYIWCRKQMKPVASLVNGNTKQHHYDTFKIKCSTLSSKIVNDFISLLLTIEDSPAIMEICLDYFGTHPAISARDFANEFYKRRQQQCKKALTTQMAATALSKISNTSTSTPTTTTTTTTTKPHIVTTHVQQTNTNTKTQKSHPHPQNQYTSLSNPFATLSPSNRKVTEHFATVKSKKKKKR